MIEYYTPSIACYHEPKHIVTIEGIQYFCADRDGVMHFDGDAAINLTGVPGIPQLHHIPQLQAEVSDEYEEVVISWPDYGLPRVKSTFWMALHNYFKSRNWRRVCLHCAGGHGRTGTAMCAILISVEKWTAPFAVEYVRDEYCWHAVESSKQVDYLCGLDEELNDREVKPSEVPESSSAIAARKAKDMKDDNLNNIIGKHMGWLDNHKDDDDDPTGGYRGGYYNGGG